MSQMLKPVGDRVLVDQKREAISKTIIVATAEGEEGDRVYPQGVVVEVGDMCSLSDIKGSVVLFNEMAGETLEHEGKKYLVLKTSDILARLC
jgi:chaperonin GroES